MIYRVSWALPLCIIPTVDTIIMILAIYIDSPLLLSLSLSDCVQLAIYCRQLQSKEQALRIIKQELDLSRETVDHSRQEIAQLVSLSLCYPFNQYFTHLTPPLLYSSTEAVSQLQTAIPLYCYL